MTKVMASKITIKWVDWLVKFSKTEWNKSRCNTLLLCLNEIARIKKSMILPLKYLKTFYMCYSKISQNHTCIAFSIFIAYVIYDEFPIFSLSCLMFPNSHFISLQWINLTDKKIINGKITSYLQDGRVCLEDFVFWVRIHWQAWSVERCYVKAEFVM